MNEQEWETWDSMAYFKGSAYMTAEDPGEPFIVIETLRGPDLPFQNGGFLGLDFIAHEADMIGRGPDKSDFMVGYDVGKFGVFG